MECLHYQPFVHSNIKHSAVGFTPPPPPETYVVVLARLSKRAQSFILPLHSSNVTAQGASPRLHQSRNVNDPSLFSRRYPSHKMQHLPLPTRPRITVRSPLGDSIRHATSRGNNNKLLPLFPGYPRLEEPSALNAAPADDRARHCPARSMSATHTSISSYSNPPPPLDWRRTPQKIYDYGHKLWDFTPLKSISFGVNDFPGVNLGDVLRKPFHAGCWYVYRDSFRLVSVALSRIDCHDRFL